MNVASCRVGSVSCNLGFVLLDMFFQALDIDSVIPSRGRSRHLILMRQRLVISDKSNLQFLNMFFEALNVESPNDSQSERIENSVVKFG